MNTILIGIDDTDNKTSRGTGFLARQVLSECQQRGLKPVSVTRHQFFRHEDIPYTSHNSGACVTIAGEMSVEAVEFVFDYVAERSACGSDPGVCIAVDTEVTSEIIHFAQAATREIVTMDQAWRLAQDAGIALRGLGGSNLGIIGALGSAGLRAEGNEGRFIHLPGLRELNSCVSAETFVNIGIELQYKSNGRQPLPDDEYHTLGWVRPGLVNHKAVLWVEWSESENAWIPVDRKKSRPLE